MVAKNGFDPYSEWSMYLMVSILLSIALTFPGLSDTMTRLLIRWSI
jgi:hypothetical protein